MNIIEKFKIKKGLSSYSYEDLLYLKEFVDFEIKYRKKKIEKNKERCK